MFKNLKLSAAVKLLNYVPKGILLKFVAELLERGMKLMTSEEARPYIEVIRRLHGITGSFLKLFDGRVAPSTLGGYNPPPYED